VLWTFAWGSTAQMESQVAGYELATAAWGAGGTIEWQWDMTALFEETGSPCSIHCAVHTEDATWVRSRASKRIAIFGNRRLTTASAYAIFPTDKQRVPHISRILRDVGKSLTRPQLLRKATLALSVLPPRKHETGRYNHVVEQHPFGQGDSSQQESQHLLSADQGEIAVHH
jgi:hypothetical protein